MNKWEKMLIVLIALCIGGVILAQTYKHGENVGYAAGWSDGNCGVGKSCEAGEE